MHRIVHISDLHFGALRNETLEPLLERVVQLDPHTLVVSGDLTQRATRDQFRGALAFLERIPCASCIVVPGNHDVPLWNVWQRFFAPRARFDRFITGESFPSTVDDQVAVVGLDTTRSFTRKNGRVNLHQLRKVSAFFEKAPPSALRVVTCHHPFVVPDGVALKERAGRSDLAAAALIQDGVDLLLTGHRHVPWVSSLGTDLPTVHAGTCTSYRVRGTENSFNDIIVSLDRVTVRRFDWVPEAHGFALDESATRVFHRATTGRIHAATTRLAASLGERNLLRGDRFERSRKNAPSME